MFACGKRLHREKKEQDVVSADDPKCLVRPSSLLSFLCLLSLKNTKQERDQAMHVADFAARAGVPVVRMRTGSKTSTLRLRGPRCSSWRRHLLMIHKIMLLKSIPHVTTAKIEELSEDALATLLRSMLGISTDIADASSSTARQPAFTCQHRSFRETLQHSSSFHLTMPTAPRWGSR